MGPPIVPPASPQLKFTHCDVVNLTAVDKKAINDAVRSNPYSRDAICEFRTPALVPSFEYIPQTWDGKNKVTGAAVDVKSATATVANYQNDMNSKIVDVGYKQYTSGHNTNCEVIKYYFIKGGDIKCLRFYDANAPQFSSLYSPSTMTMKKKLRKTRGSRKLLWNQGKTYALTGNPNIFK